MELRGRRARRFGANHSGSLVGASAGALTAVLIEVEGVPWYDAMMLTMTAFGFYGLFQVTREVKSINREQLDGLERIEGSRTIPDGGTKNNDEGTTGPERPLAP